MIRQEIINKAISLRKAGNSYKQIHAFLNVSKSTLYTWLHSVKLNKLALERIKKTTREGRLKGLANRRTKIANRDNLIKDQVRSSIRKISLTIELSKLLCAFLYWAEGEKSSQNRVAFINSDPTIISTFMSLFRKSFNVDETKFRAILHLHSYHNEKAQKQFWSNLTGIPLNRFSIYNKPNSGKNIRLDYPGCLSIRYHDVKVFKEIQGYYLEFSRQLGGFV